MPRSGLYKLGVDEGRTLHPFCPLAFSRSPEEKGCGYYERKRGNKQGGGERLALCVDADCSGKHGERPRPSGLDRIRKHADRRA